MRHLKSGRKLNRSAAHRKALMRNMATSLIIHERIQTTTPKAKELRPFVESLITLGKRGGLHALRQAASVLTEREALDKLFGSTGDGLAGRFATRPGGYTRITHLGNRSGDNAPISVIEFVDAAPPSVAVGDETVEA